MSIIPRRQAFTPIELLIVVAIIAILAAIAAPNFLEAQVRAKGSRVRADLRTATTALEAYRIDGAAYPPNDAQYNVLPRQRTTPAALISDAKLVAPFSDKETHPVHGELARFYTYGKVVTLAQLIVETKAGCKPPPETVAMPGLNPGAFKKYGGWRRVSNGPDRAYSSADFIASDPVLRGADILCDPTNGTASWGNILQTQLYGAAGGVR